MSHGGQGEDWQVRMEAHYLVVGVCELSHGGQGERLAHRVMEAITWLRLSVN